jgi:hypothetical protein
VVYWARGFSGETTEDSMQGGGWQPPPGGGGYGPPGGGGGYGGPPGYGAPPPAPPYAGGPLGGIAPQYGNYEFNEYESSIIDKTADRAKLWGIISAVIGALQIVGSCGMVKSPTLATYLPAGIVAIVVGVTFIGAGNSLKAVTTTQGNDLMHLSQAMQKLTAAFTIEIICTIVGTVVAAVALVFVVLYFLASAAS